MFCRFLEKNSEKTRAKPHFGCGGFLVLIIFPIAVFLSCSLLESPSNPVEDNPTASFASCKMCHSYPGSPYCRIDTLLVENVGESQCIRCHTGSIRADSMVMSEDTGWKAIYFDESFLYGDLVYPVTDSLHANQRSELKTCTACHEYPSSRCRYPSRFEDGGYSNITYKAGDRACFGCHAKSIAFTKDTVELMQMIDETTYVALNENDVVCRDSVFQGFDGEYAHESDLHRNRITDVVQTHRKIGECGGCHELPPRTGFHTYHRWSVPAKDRVTNCIECHPKTILFDTLPPDTSGIRYAQHMFILDQDTLPLLSGEYHPNGTVEVELLFHREFDGYSRDELNMYNPLTAECSNVGCHGGPDGRYFDYTTWGGN